ncbi:MAG: non-canonical purine NTP pyrophosphatase, RdgB/HAM1 family [Phototrophicales bacterium]|nr:MAG: non-canonical purine NTP pyrophosphatase, RdgB/HAM1 family [Phototrophicales bacterium]RMG76409.1 MAG: RdgB/HAM1 family non-canonical purine NTP pyrophosphatase [Chloroflexota bacterium]
MEIVIGTTNPGKVKEYRELLADIPITLLSLDDVNLGHMDVPETGETFMANAQLKAKAYAQASGKFALADDSGLCVDALNGAPGVYSARYGGEGLDDAGRRQKLLEQLTGVTQRTAYFECVIAVAHPQQQTCLIAQGVCEGKIALEESSGAQGFGYDAIFIPDGYDRTFGDLEAHIKHQISHRGRAARKLIVMLQAFLSDDLPK